MREQQLKVSNPRKVQLIRNVYNYIIIFYENEQKLYIFVRVTMMCDNLIGLNFVEDVKYSLAKPLVLCRNDLCAFTVCLPLYKLQKGNDDYIDTEKQNCILKDWEKMCQDLNDRCNGWWYSGSLFFSFYFL